MQRIEAELELKLIDENKDGETRETLIDRARFGMYLDPDADLSKGPNPEHLYRGVYRAVAHYTEKWGLH